jgi:hypothetical protein
MLFQHQIAACPAVLLSFLAVLKDRIYRLRDCRHFERYLSSVISSGF